jgi:hypothetical protein
MDRLEIELKLNRDRNWLLETYLMLSPDDLLRGVTPSEHDPATMWTPKDHLAHLAGIELNFVRMIRRHLGGEENPVALTTDESGKGRTRDEVMAYVHSMTEAWTVEHRDKSLSEVVQLGQQARAQTLALLAEIGDARLDEAVAGAPWGDGKVGTLLALHADHGRMHWYWVKEGMGKVGMTPPR